MAQQGATPPAGQLNGQSHGATPRPRQKAAIMASRHSRKPRLGHALPHDPFNAIVAPPRVQENPVAFECRCTQIVQLQTAAGEVVTSWLVLGEVVDMSAPEAGCLLPHNGRRLTAPWNEVQASIHLTPA
jgi:hypothetical protein